MPGRVAAANSMSSNVRTTASTAKTMKVTLSRLTISPDTRTIPVTGWPRRRCCAVAECQGEDSPDRRCDGVEGATALLEFSDEQVDSRHCPRPVATTVVAA